MTEVEATPPSFAHLAQELDKKPTELLDLVALIFYLVEWGYTEDRLIRKVKSLRPEQEGLIDEAIALYGAIKSPPA